MQIHLDTDVGGDPDDACALAMLLGWPDAGLLAVTTVADAAGYRAAYAEHLLGLAGRVDIPVTAGAGCSLTTLAIADPVLGDARHWPPDLPPRPSPPGAAFDALAASISAGATVVAIGPFTNLALLEIARPGTLARARVVVMGGWVRPPAPGLPPWGPEMDFNVQWDARAAKVVFGAAGDLTLATLPATLAAHLRAADLPHLRAAGPLGALLASQSAAHGEATGMADLGRAHAALPDDLVNVHYDPVAAAAALGWPGIAWAVERLRPTRMDDGTLRLTPDPAGRPARVAVDVDGPAFAAAWLAAVERAARPG